MSNFIHKFSTAAEREAATYSEPWVSYTTETDKVEYSKIEINIDTTNSTTTVTPLKTVPYDQLGSINVSSAYQDVK